MFNWRFLIFIKGGTRLIYLDNAATTGRKPPQVISAVNMALQNYSANPGRSGHSLSVDTAMLVYDARKKIGYD